MGNISILWLIDAVPQSSSKEHCVLAGNGVFIWFVWRHVCCYHVIVLMFVCGLGYESRSPLLNVVDPHVWAHDLSYLIFLFQNYLWESKAFHIFANLLTFLIFISKHLKILECKYAALVELCKAMTGLSRARVNPRATDVVIGLIGPTCLAHAESYVLMQPIGNILFVSLFSSKAHFMVGLQT